MAISGIFHKFRVILTKPGPNQSPMAGRLVKAGAITVVFASLAIGCGKKEEPCNDVAELHSLGLNSAIRCKHESTQEAFEKRKLINPNLKLNKDSPYAIRFPVAQFNVDMIPFPHTADELNRAFKYVRDVPFLPATTGLGFPRRLAYLYPDDGCWSRAYLTVARAAEYLGPEIPRFYQLYAFGKMGFKTPNAQPGRNWVYWSYHVVPLVRIGNQAYVIDVAVEPSAPLTLQDWLSRLAWAGEEKIEVAVCDGFAYGMYQPCAGAKEMVSMKSALRHHYVYLQREEERQRSLGRNIAEVLGPRPPW
jgi:hypothetical protein